MPKTVDYTGQRFDRRKVLGFHGRDKNGHAIWDVQCDCGNILTSLTQNLKRTRGCPFCSHKDLRPYRRKRPFEVNYKSLLKRSKHLVLITYEQFLSFTAVKECHYCGSTIPWREYRTREKGNSGAASFLDRKDSDKPYEINNIVVCCSRCNYGKSHRFTYEEWKQVGALICSWREKKV